MNCINIEPYLFIYFAFLIIFGNLAIYLMRKNVSSNYDKESVKPRGLDIVIWEVVLPKRYLTSKGIFWRTVSIWCCAGFGIFLACWFYIPSSSWACNFQMVPR